MVRIMRGVDQQIFSGYKDHLSMFDKDIQKKIENAAKMTANLLKQKGNNKIIVSGSGTSGRIAYFVTRRYNIILK